MKTEDENPDITPTNQPEDLPGYPLYPPSEDIYNQETKEADLDPDDLTRKKAPNEKPWDWNEKKFEQDVSGGDLDIPGSELDDAQERIGSEDEENNHYGIGGDEHNNMEEDKGS
jgi:hypothetical protein